MKRFILPSISLVVALVLFLGMGIPVLAQDPPGMDVDIGIQTGGDANVGIDINSGGDTNVSVNGDGLATQQDVYNARIVGTEWDLFTDMEVRRLSKWSWFVDNHLGLLTEGLAKNIVEDQAENRATENQFTVIKFEQSGQDFVMGLNRDNVAKLRDLVSNLENRSDELESALDANEAYVKTLVTYYDNRIQVMLLMVGLLSIIGIGLLAYLLNTVYHLKMRG